MAQAKTNESESFEENFRKLEKFSQELQENKVGIDQLVPRMKEALGAIKVCKKVLQETKLQLTEIGQEFEELSKGS